MREVTPLSTNRYVNGKSLFVLWSLGDRCNYSCSYCPPQLHKGRWGWQNINHILNFVKHIKNHYRKPIQFCFSGGEPLLYKPIFELTEKIKQIDPNILITVITNGSLLDRIDFGSLDKNIDRLIMSFHPEHANLDNFIEMAINIKSQGLLEVIHIMATTEHWDQCLKACQRAKKLSLPYILKPITNEFKLKDSGKYYSPSQKEMILKTNAIYSEKIIFDQKVDLPITPLDLIATGDNKWAGSTCFAGIDMLEVNINGDVRRAPCSEGGVLANINTDLNNPHLPDKPVVCTKEVCACIPAICCRKTI